MYDPRLLFCQIKKCVGGAASALHFALSQTNACQLSYLILSDVLCYNAGHDSLSLLLSPFGRRLLIDLEQARLLLLLLTSHLTTPIPRSKFCICYTKVGAPSVVVIRIDLCATFSYLYTTE